MGIFLIVFALCSIVGGILMLRKSAKKFNLTPEQLKKIKKRNELLEQEEREEKK
jgi:hypothetical protein